MAEKMLNGKPVWKAPKLEIGMYHDAQKEGSTLTELLEKEQAKTEESPYLGMSREQIARHRKALKAKGEVPAPTAFEKQLMLADINPTRDTVEKFFLQTSDTVLFPEFIATGVTEGFIETSLVSQLSAQTVPIEFGNLTVRRLKLGDEGEDQDAIQLRRLGQGAEIPETVITAASETVEMKKHGRGIVRTYEYSRNVRINLALVALRRIGARIGIDETDDLIGTLINGDGNSNTPATTIQPAATGVITMNDILEWIEAMPGTYVLSDYITRSALRLQIRQALASFSAAVSGTARAREEGFDLPALWKWDRSVIPADRAIGIDRRNALVSYASNVITEADQLISRQVERTYVTKYTGYQILDNRAVAVWDTQF